MKETKLGGIEFNDDTSNSDPYIIGTFGPEGTGKTRFPITGPEVVGFVPLEQKSYATISMAARELGKRVYKPKDPDSLIVNPRKIKGLETEGEVKAQKFFMEHYKKVYEAVYALLENKDVRIVVIDKFTQLCTWIEFALNGMSGKFMKVQGKVYQDKRESNQEITDFINSLSQYKKPVILTNAHKDEYANDKATGRLVHDGFKFLGSHCSMLVEHVSNGKWNPESEDEEKSWHFGVSIRKCQRNPQLEGPDGQLILKDDQITLPNLIMAVDQNADMEEWM